MKHMNNKIVKLLHEGFSMSTLENLTEKQLNVLFHKIISEQPQPTEKTVTSKVTELPAGAKAVVGGVTVSNDAGKTVITQTQNEGELDEEEEFDSMDVKKGEDDQDPIQKQGPDGMSEDVLDSNPSDKKGNPVKKSSIDDVLSNTGLEVNVNPSELKIYDLDTPSDRMKLYNNPSELSDLFKKNNNDDGEGRQIRTKTEKDINLDTKYYFTTKHLGPNRKLIVYNYRTGEVIDVNSKKVLFKFEKRLPQLQVYYELRDYGVIKRNRKIQHGPDVDKSESNLQEKSVSKQQQKLMGLALSVKKGDTPKSKVTKSVQNMAKEMSKKELEDFASTKHKGLPITVNEKNEVEKLEESILRIIENHLPPHTTKGELLNYIRRNA